jgi:hypothetical protein
MAKSKKVSSDWKKNNYSPVIKVSEAQVQKLRDAGTKSAAIKKYGSDPKMREALNRFYGKAEVTRLVGGSASSSSKPSGPGGKMPSRPAGGPGSKMTSRDGRGAKSSSKTPTTSKTKKSGPSWDAFKNSTEVKSWTKGFGMGVGTVATVFGPGKVKAVTTGAKAVAKAGAKKQAAANIATRSTAKADEAIKAQKAATAAKNAAKTGKGSGAGSAARAAKLQREAAAAKAAANKAAEQARNANARSRSLGAPTAPKVKTGPKSKTAAPKAVTSGTAKQADEMLMNMKNLAKKKSVRRTGYVAGGAAYLARPQKDKK